MAAVVVLADHTDGRVHASAAELLTLAAGLGEAVAVLVALPAEHHDTAVAELGRWGARTVHLVAADPSPAPELVARAVAHVVEGSTPAGVLLAATRTGTEVAAHLGLLLGAGVLTGAEAVEDGFVARTSVLGATWSTRSRVTRGIPVVTVRPGTATPLERPSVPRRVHAEVAAPASRAARVVAREPLAGAEGLRVPDAQVVVAAGRGTGGDLDAVRDLADALGAAVAGSRAAVDEGWLPQSAQVGQTGHTIAPRAYVAAGISGAVQHLAGIRSAQVVVAVNSDPDAPIFEVADLGIVGDLFTVLPQAAAALRARAGASASARTTHLTEGPTS